MKRQIPLVFLMFVFSAVFAQYQGQPWHGTPWSFGLDTVANFSHGSGQSHNRGGYNGIPHYLYDIGAVDTLARAADDLQGTLVAGSGDNVNSSGSGNTFRLTAANADSKTLSASELAGFNSPFYAGMFHNHGPRAVFDRSGGWYRYTLNFEPGNYKAMFRLWQNAGRNQAFWIRFYDKETMNPLIPWTRMHGSPDVVGEGMTRVNVAEAPWVSLVSSPTNLPNQTNWMMSVDEYSLSGEVVMELVNVYPSSAHGSGTGVGGVFGELSFVYAGPQSDKFAPVVDPWMFSYDDMTELDMALSEPGTFYILPAGTPVEEIETAYIDKAEMTAEDKYVKRVAELLTDGLSRQVQFYTSDAAGNTRMTPAITFRNVILPDTLAGNQGDHLGMNVTREGIVFLVQKGTQTDMASLMGAFSAGNADMAEVTPGRDTLIIQNLSGNKNLELLLFDLQSGQTSKPIDFKLGDGDATSVVELKKVQVNIYVDRGTIFLSHNGEFEDLYIYDALGRQRSHQRVYSNNLTINASDFSDGVYIYRLYGRNSGVSTGKFLINSRN
jgi:hypothetical protein